VFGKKGLSSIDIGNSSIKTVELKKQFGKVTLKAFKSQVVRSEVFSGGEIVDPVAMQSSVKSALKSFPKELIFSCCGTSMMVKNIRIPKMDPDFISEQIKWEAEQYIPFNIEQVNIEFEVVDNPTDGDTMGLLLVAILKDKVSAYANLFTQSGFEPKIADVSGFALANCFSFNYPEKLNGAVILLDIGAFYTNLVVMNQGKVVYYRDIQFGGQKYDEELAKNLGLDEKEAKKIKESKDPSSLPGLAADTIVGMNDKLSSQILGSLDFFKNTEGFKANFSQVYVTGGASLTAGLTQSLSKAVGVGVEYLNPLKKVGFSQKILKTVDESKLQYTSAVAVGLSVRELSNS